MTNISKIKLQDTTYVIKDLDAYVKPSTGIPASDLASGVIPDVSNFITNSVNDLANYYLKSETYTQTEVETLIGAINQFHYEIAASTSAVDTPASNVLYLIGPTGSGADQYEEYIYPNATLGWTKIGDTSIDLSGYVTTTALNTALADYTTTADLTTLLAGKQDTINDLSDIRSGAALGATALQSYTETDPTVPDWAKASTKPSYSYSEISNTPSLGTAASKDVAASGDASSTEVVMGNDSRLTDARNASDVYSWAKAETKPNYSYNEISGTPTIPTKTSDLDNDSGFLTSHQDISGKADKDTDAVIGNAAMFDASGNPVDGGTALSTIVSGAAAGATAYQKPNDGIPKTDLASAVQTSLGLADTALQSHQDISGKADKVSGATAGHLAKLDANGNLVDGGDTADKAKNLIAPVTQDAEFVYRKTGGSLEVDGTAGAAEIQKVKGKTLAWNQLIKNGNFSDSSSEWWTGQDIDSFSVADGIATFHCSTINTGNNQIRNNVGTLISGHKAYYSFEARYVSALSKARFMMFVGNPIWWIYAPTFELSSEFCRYSGIILNDSEKDAQLLSIAADVVDTTIQVTNVFVVDLTLMFGAGNEPSTPEEFESMFPKPYYEYNPGQLISNSASGIETVGFNQWDEEWELGLINSNGENVNDSFHIRSKNYIGIVGGEAYYILIPSPYTLRVCSYDGNKNFIRDYGYTIGRQTINTSANEKFIRFGVFSDSYGTTYKNDICINISNASRNGTYEPYKQPEVCNLNLTSLKGKKDGKGKSVVVFPDGLRSAGSVRDEIVGNKAIKRVGRYNLGDGTWTRNGSTVKVFELQIVDRASANSNVICARYANKGIIAAYVQITEDKLLAEDNVTNYVFVRDDSYTDADTFKSAMSDVLLYYELAEPEEYILDSTPDFSYPVDGNGTEKRLPEDTESSVSAPFCADIKYALNGAATLSNLDTNYVNRSNITQELGGSAEKVVSQALLQRVVDGIPYGINYVPTEYELEQTSSPEFDVANQYAVNNYVKNMGGYLFYVKSGTVYAAKLSNDWTKFEDGTAVTSAIRANTETMIHVPDCYFKAEGKKMQFNGLYPIEGGHKFDSPNWVGAYQMSSGGHSRPGSGSAHSKTMSAFWDDAQAIHTGFGLANYQFQCLIDAVYQALFGNLNSEYVLSDGNTRPTSNWEAYRDLAHGQADSLGSGSGCVAAVDGAGVTRYVTKLCGFEDMFDKLWEFRQGIRFYMDGSTRMAVVYSGNQVSNSASGRTISGVLASASGQYITSMECGEYWDMLPKSINGSDSSYYCDGYWSSTSGELLLVGGRASYGSQCGLLCAGLDGGFSYSAGNTGARLAFYSEPIIVSGSELVALMA